jgi:hypothetical protein
MRPVAVVMLDVGARDTLGLAAAGDQDRVEALPAHGAGETPSVRVRLRRVSRRREDLNPSPRMLARRATRRVRWRLLDGGVVLR